MQWKIALVVTLLVTMSSLSTFATEGKSHEQMVFTLSDVVNLEIDFGNGTVVSYANANGTNVLEATASKVELVVEWYGSLAYVVEIDGVHNDAAAGLFWQYWVNGDRAPFAANQMIVAANDTIEWKRAPSTFTSTETNTVPQQLDSSLIMGTILTVILGPIFLGFLNFVKNRRMSNE